jgi:hypothetical protein
MSTINIVPLFVDGKGTTLLATTGDRGAHDLDPQANVKWEYRRPGDQSWLNLQEAFGDDHRIVRVENRLADGTKEISIRVVGPDGAISDTYVINTGLPTAKPFELPDVPVTDGATKPQPVEVSMTRTKVPPTKDEILWSVIRASTTALSVNEYLAKVNALFGDFLAGARTKRTGTTDARAIVEQRGLVAEPFFLGGPDAFKVLRFATELFVTTRCGVLPATEPLALEEEEEETRYGHQMSQTFEKMWTDYLVDQPPVDGKQIEILPYLDLIRRKLGDINTIRSSFASLIDQEAGLLQEKLVHPPMLELIWSYWMEEGMLVQAFNSIVRRFQNLRGPGERDPLAQLEIDPLRSVANLLWGWTQDETGRLSVLRRAHEYDHQYGFTLHGKAVADMHTVDRRSKFLESFHNLLWRCMQFYRQDDDTTVMADGFAVLNSLKETHYTLSQGAHNQFANLALTARQEMLSQMWILSRPEMREFLGTRVMVAYPEPWMDRVETVKTLKGWTDTSVVHFRDLAVFGEQILLSVRYGAWSIVNDPANAANWARYWRAEVQGYAHAYRAVTGVDLTADVTDQGSAETRFLPPSVHLRNRLLAQAR